MTDLGTLGGSFSRATSVNASGQVVGAADNLSGEPHAFITGPNGVGMTALGTLGGYFSNAKGINASGQVVGSAQTRNGDFHAFITGPNGVGMTDLGTLDGSLSDATGINASGQVIGMVRTLSGDFHAFITGPNGVGMTDLGTLGSSSVTIAYGINSFGQVVGTAYSTYNGNGPPPGPLGPRHAFITGANGVGMTDLNSLLTLPGGGWDYFHTAVGINDHGQIIANAVDGHAYLISTVPEPNFAVHEPETYVLMLAGLGIIGVIDRRKKQTL